MYSIHVMSTLMGRMTDFHRPPILDYTALRFLRLYSEEAPMGLVSECNLWKIMGPHQTLSLINEKDMVRRLKPYIITQ